MYIHDGLRPLGPPCKNSQEATRRGGFPPLGRAFKALASSVFFHPVRFTVLFCALVWALVVLAVMPAFAQVPCSTREGAAAQLKEKYLEDPVSIGVTNGGALMELFASKDGETWTLVVTLGNGRTCQVAAGKYWQQVKRVVGEES